MNKLNKVLLYAGVIAAITGIPSCYAAQNPGAGEMFDSLSTEQQKQFIYGTYKKLKNDKRLRKKVLKVALQTLGVDLATEGLKLLPQEAKDLALEPVRQLLPVVSMRECTSELIEALSYPTSIWKNSYKLTQLRNAISANNKNEVVQIINTMRTQNNRELQKNLDEAILDASRHGSVATILFLTKLGANINARGFFGNTPLHEAAFYNCTEIIKFLISHGVNIDAKDSTGKTPLHFAANHNSKEAGEILISKGADINIKDKYGHTPLYVAAYGNRKDMEQLLRSKGAQYQ